MSTIELYGLGLRKGQIGRALTRLDVRTSLDAARTLAHAEVTGAQMDAVAALAQRAMQGVAFVSQVEQQLGQTVPLAVTRLQAIGDLAALGMGQILADTATQVRGR